MKGKVYVVICIVFLLTVGTFMPVMADTLLFPVIAVNQPSVTTIISVINRPGYTGTYHKYIYRYKDALTGGLPNITGSCVTQSFVRPTFDGDVVSFDASGSLNGGNALFGDTHSYSGSFAMAGSGARRAYLLVTDSDAAGTRVNVGHNGGMRGEAIVMDILYGAAWGYKAITDETREDYSFINFADGGGVYAAMPDGIYANKRFGFFPSEWTTRFFVTPIGSNMDSANLTATVQLETAVYDRNGNSFVAAFPAITATCTAAIDLSALTESTVWSSVQSTGGFAWLDVTAGDAIIYKLEYVVNNATYGGTNNNGYLFSAYGLY